MKTKAYSIIILTGVLSFIITLPLRAWHPFLQNLTGIDIDTFTYPILCFFLIVFLQNKFQGKLSSWSITVTFLIIILLPDIIIRNYHGNFMSTLPSLPDPLLRVLTILLGWLYFHIHNKSGKRILAIGTLIGVAWVSAYGIYMWSNHVESFVDNYRKTETNVLIFTDKNNQTININSYRGKYLVLYILENEKQLLENLTVIKAIDEYAKNSKSIAFSLVFCNNDSSGKGTLQDAKLLQQNNPEIPYMYISDSILKEIEITHRPEMVIIGKEGGIKYQSENRILGGTTGITSEKIIQLFDLFTADSATE